MKTSTHGLWGNIVAVGLGMIVAFLLTEILSRIFIPIFPGTRKLGLGGERLNIESVQAGAVYRQFSQEYDAVTTITPDGYRIPDGGDNPRIIFLGDSFTFGQGLNDEHTFPFIVCTSLQVSCANLGVPGASTISELDRLETYITDKGWKPRQVWLFIFAMTQFLGAGNDLYDNIRTAERQKRKDQKSRTATHGGDQADITKNRRTNSPVWSLVLDFRYTLLQYSNLARVVKFYFGPSLKALWAPTAKEETLDQALALMERQLNRLTKMSEQFNFRTDIFLIHPVQDLLRGSYKVTESTLRAISPTGMHSTAHLFLPSPEQYFFSLDGHFNEKGE